MNPEPMKPSQARIVKGRTATWPSRVASYWDCAPWGHGRKYDGSQIINIWKA